MKQLGPYQLQEVLGQGGMATVYRAYQNTLEREVAIKVIASAYTTNPTFVQRFQREARATAKLRHPNILTIYDFGQDPTSGEYYIVSELVDGKTLRERLGQPFELEAASRLLQQLADALDYAHENGIVHRDVKPGNILLDKRGRVTLGDFGIALLLEGSSELTASGLGVGTPSYMSPEQAIGQTVDGRSDQYSLGIVLYEMLTGTTPFKAPTPVAMVMAHATRPLPDPRYVNPNLPIEVVQVLNRALAKDPAQRFPTTGEFARAFSAAIKAPNTEGKSPISDVTPTIPITGGAEGYVLPNNAYPSQGYTQPEQYSATNLAVPGGWPTIRPSNQEGTGENQRITTPARNVLPPPPRPTLPVGASFNQPPRSGMKRGTIAILGAVALVVIIGAALTVTLLLGQPKTQAPASVGQAALATETSVKTPAGAGPTTTGQTPQAGAAGGGSACTTSVPAPEFTHLGTSAGSKKGQLNLQILETACKPAKADNVAIKIYRESDPGTVITSQCCANQFSLPLGPGFYRTVVSYASSVEQSGPAIEVKEGQEVFQSINLQLGQVQLELSESNGKSAKADAVSVKVFKAGDRNTAVTTACCANKLSLYLKPGRYEIAAIYANDVQVNGTPFDIKEGDTLSQSINYGVGRLQLGLVETDSKSAKADAVSIKVFKPGDYNTPVTTACCTNQTEIVLRPGSYEVVATYADGVKAAPLPVQISEGQLSKQTINFHVGQASLEITRASGQSVNGNDVSVQVYKQGDPNTTVTTGCCATKFSFSLVPGSYRIVITAGSVTKTPYELQIEVKEGQITSQTAKL